MVRVLENTAYKKRAKELDLFSLEEGRKRGMLQSSCIK